MTLNRRCAVDVFWNLVTLMDDYALELPLPEPSADVLPPGARVCLPLGGERPLAEIMTAARRLIAAGMRPVVALAAPGPGASRHIDRTLGALAGIGVRELVLLWPAATSLTSALDDVTRVVCRCDPGRRGFTEIGVATVGHAGLNVGHEPSAELLRAFEEASDVSVAGDIGITLLTPPVRSVESVIAWEQSLRAAGNLFPVRVRLPETGPNPFRHTIPLLLGMAAAAEADPGCLISEVQFVLRGPAEPAAAFADDIRDGNFVVEDSEYGYQLSMLRER